MIASCFYKQTSFTANNCSGAKAKGEGSTDPNNDPGSQPGTYFAYFSNYLYLAHEHHSLPLLCHPLAVAAAVAAAEELVALGSNPFHQRNPAKTH